MSKHHEFISSVISSEDNCAIIRARALKLGATRVVTTVSSPGYVKSTAVFVKKTLFTQFKEWVAKQRNLELCPVE